jgi:hypothetical protein
LKPVRASLAASQFLIQLQYWKQQFQSPVACAVTGPKAGAQLACANLGRRAETSCLAETGPDYGAQIACASKHSAPSILMNGWEPNAGTTKPTAASPGPPNPSDSAFVDPHPRRTHSDPMRAAPPRAPAPAPRTHPHNGGDPTKSQPRACFPPYLPSPRPRPSNTAPVWSSSPEGACGSHAAPSRSSSPVHGDPRRRQGLRAAACPPCLNR